MNNISNYKRYPESQYKARKNYYKPSQYAPNHHCQWTLHELDAIMDRSKPDKEISKEIGRSVCAIQRMRWAIKKGLHNG